MLVASMAVRAESLSATDAAALYDKQTTYSIFRKGKQIGKHQLSIVSAGSDIVVTVQSKITVTVLKVPVFRFLYTSTENWRNGKLISVQSVTTTNKEIETASLNNTENGSELSYNGKNSKADLIQFATNHWYKAAVNQTTLFNTVKGQASEVVVENLGTEVLDIGGEQINATHYAYSGDIIAETWYDDAGRWLKLSFKGKDGSNIDYLIDSR